MQYPVRRFSDIITSELTAAQIRELVDGLTEEWSAEEREEAPSIEWNGFNRPSEY